VLPGIEMMTCPNLSAPAEVMQHIVEVESGRNPFAIGVVGARLERQPQDLAEAIATAQMLESQGYNFSLGLAQVNKANLTKYGLDSYEKAFQTCANLAAGSRILAECFTSSHGDWGKAFSCYYSGNFTTGYQDGYVQKVYDAINRAANSSVSGTPIPLVADATLSRRTPIGPVAVVGDESAQRIAMRRVIDTAVNAALTPVVASRIDNAPTPSPLPEMPGSRLPQAATPQEGVAANVQEGVAKVAGETAPPAAIPRDNSANQVFVPVVHGPNDPPGAQPTSTSMQQTAMAPAMPGVDHADLRQPATDSAFVF